MHGAPQVCPLILRLSSTSSLSVPALYTPRYLDRPQRATQVYQRSSAPASIWKTANVRSAPAYKPSSCGFQQGHLNFCTTQSPSPYRSDACGPRPSSHPFPPPPSHPCPFSPFCTSVAPVPQVPTVLAFVPQVPTSSFIGAVAHITWIIVFGVLISFGDPWKTPCDNHGRNFVATGSSVMALFALMFLLEVATIFAGSQGCSRRYP